MALSRKETLHIKHIHEARDRLYLISQSCTCTLSLFHMKTRKSLITVVSKTTPSPTSPGFLREDPFVINLIHSCTFWAIGNQYQSQNMKEVKVLMETCMNKLWYKPN